MDWRHTTEIMTAGPKVFDEFKNLIVWAKDTPGFPVIFSQKRCF